MKILSVAQMQMVEKTADAGGLSYNQMMKNAGRGIALWMLEHLSFQNGVIGLIGSGNNGGDTLIALDTLAQKGIRTIGFIIRDRGEDQLIADYLDHGGSVIDLSQNQNLSYFKASLSPGAIILDGVLGTGLRLPLRGLLCDVMATLHHMVKNSPGALVIAVDCPSGMDCDSGEVSEEILHAQHTLCIAAIKQGLLKPPGCTFVGNLHRIDIGIENLNRKLEQGIPILIDQAYVADHLPLRPPTGHKGTFGTCLIVAGTQPFTGAAYLSGKAAYRSGCGLVNIATLDKVQSALSGQLVETVWTVLPEVAGTYGIDGIELLNAKFSSADADSLIIGPGWGMMKKNIEFLDQLLDILPIGLSLLVDADGLKLLTHLDSWWERLPAHTVLTPHPGEMSILTGLDIPEIQSNRWQVAREFARQWDVVLVLKGAVTVIAAPSGDLLINPVCDPALATAGSGDVLAGVIGGLMAQGSPVLNASAIGTWIHGQAGLFAKQRLGSDAAVTAMDILDSLPNTIRITRKDI